MSISGCRQHTAACAAEGKREWEKAGVCVGKRDLRAHARARARTHAARPCTRMKVRARHCEPRQLPNVSGRLAECILFVRFDMGREYIRSIRSIRVGLLGLVY